MESKGLLNSIIKRPTTADHSLNPELSCTNDKIKVTFTDGCLKQEIITYSHGKIVYLYIVYELKLSPYLQNNDFAIKKCLFRAFQITKNADCHKYSYSEYDIGLDVCLYFSLPDGSDFSKNVIIFGVDISSSAHIDNKRKGYLNCW